MRNTNFSGSTILPVLRDGLTGDFQFSQWQLGNLWARLSLKPRRLSRVQRAAEKLGQGFAVFWAGAVLAVLLGIVGGSLWNSTVMWAVLYKTCPRLARCHDDRRRLYDYSRFLPKTSESRTPPQAKIVPQAKSLPQTPLPLGFEPERPCLFHPAQKTRRTCSTGDEPGTRPQKRARQTE